MTVSYYKLPDDREELIGVALSLTTYQIMDGQINPVSLCRRLVAEIRVLQSELKIAQGGRPTFTSTGDPLAAAP